MPGYRFARWQAFLRSKSVSLDVVEGASVKRHLPLLAAVATQSPAEDAQSRGFCSAGEAWRPGSHRPTGQPQDWCAADPTTSGTLNKGVPRCSAVLPSSPPQSYRFDLHGGYSRQSVEARFACSSQGLGWLIEKALS